MNAYHDNNNTLHHNIRNIPGVWRVDPDHITVDLGKWYVAFKNDKA